jgi:hypothetical protein
MFQLFMEENLLSCLVRRCQLDLIQWIGKSFRFAVPGDRVLNKQLPDDQTLEL